VMPTGKNIHQFDGTVVLNDVAAFVWEKLTLGSSREDLLEAILSEFDVDKQRAEQDLDALLDKLRGYEVIEEESV
ncbi:MAG: PqqD family protein, partial [Acutalibacteraceae bacterium]